MAYEIPTRWPLVETLENREGDLFRDSRIVNGYAEFNPKTKSYTVEKRPGVASGEFTPGIPNGSDQGIFNFDNAIIQLTGNKAYRNGVLLGGISGGAGNAGLYTAGFTSQDVDLMMLAQPNNGYYINGFTLNQITDPNYPPTIVPGIAYLNGRFYVMDSAGRIFGALNLDDPSAWDSLNVIVAQQKSGVGVYLAEQLSYVCAMKSKSIEIFWDSGQSVGGAGSTLQPIPGAMIPYGCQDSGTVQLLDGTLIWVTTNESGSPQVGRMDNLQFQIISTPPVDRLLKNISYGSTGSFTLKLGGHRFYILQIIPGGIPIFGGTGPAITLVFDIDQNLWYIWSDNDGIGQWPFYSSCAFGTSTPPLTFVQALNGQVYRIAEDYVTPTDLGQVFPVDIYTPNYDAEIDREKFMSALYFNSDITPGSVVNIRWSDDDYATWTNMQTLDLSLEKPRLDDLGSFYRRAFHIRHAMPTRFRIKTLGMQMALGTL